MSQDTINRNIYGRLYKGAFQNIADTNPADLIGAVFDKTYMPALVIDPGKQVYYDVEVAVNTSVTFALPPAYDVAQKLYIAVQADLRARITFTSPTHGSGRIVLLDAFDNAINGVHRAFWTYQGDMTTFAVSAPSVGDGGALTHVQVFMYEIPDLGDFESYYDKQIGLGVS